MLHVSIGTSALSKFRLEKLRAALQSTAPKVKIAETRHCYFVELAVEALAQSDARLLNKVLGLGRSAGEPAAAGQYQRLLVVPRLGTISPWSTKATDIAQHCGLQGVKRI
jgi:phosphoribosylformylglycinamidine synthase